MFKISERVNILRKFRDDNTKKFKQLTAIQFLEVWKHYDINGILK